MNVKIRQAVREDAEIILSEECTQVSVIAREEAKGFYEKLGMTEEQFSVFVKKLYVKL